MKKLINILALAVLLSGCGLFKDRSVHKVVKQVDSVSNVDSSTLSKSEVVDLSKTVILEKAHGVAYTKPVSTEVKSDLGSLLSGLQVVRDSGIFKIVQSYDSLSKQINTSISIMPQPVTFDIDKMTTVDNNIKTQVEAGTNYKKNESVKKSESTKDSVSKSSPISKFIPLVALIVIGLVVYFAVKKYS